MILFQLFAASLISVQYQSDDYNITNARLLIGLGDISAWIFQACG